MSHYASINESIRLSVVTDIPVETKSALATFCRRNGFPHLYFEILEPLLARTDLILALATTERPWPPKGIGSQTIEAVGIAMIGSESRAYLTPVLTDRKHCHQPRSCRRCDETAARSLARAEGIVGRIPRASRGPRA